MINQYLEANVDDYLTAAEVAKRFNVTSKTVTVWIDNGLLKGAKKLNPDIRNSPFIVPVSSVNEFEKTRNQTTGDN